MTQPTTGARCAVTVDPETDGSWSVRVWSDGVAFAHVTAATEVAAEGYAARFRQITAEINAYPS